MKDRDLKCGSRNFAPRVSDTGCWSFAGRTRYTKNAISHNDADIFGVDNSVERREQVRRRESEMLNQRFSAGASNRIIP
jgi:hypothetical protein